MLLIYYYLMKKVILILFIFLLMGSVCAGDFSNVSVKGVDFEIPQQYAQGTAEKNRYVYHDLRTFAVLCVDDYIVSNYGGYYGICDSSNYLTIGDRPAMLLTMYNNYINKNVSYLYFPVNQSIFCICFQGNNVDENISHIVESAPESGMTSDAFYGILKEAYDEHQNRKYQDTLTNYYSDYNNNQHQNSKNDQLIKWYLLTQGGRR